MTTNPTYLFTETELSAWLAAPVGAQRAMDNLLGRVIDAAHDSFASAGTEREAAVSQGVVRCAKALRDALRGAPDRAAALAKRTTVRGNSPTAAGVV